jgi:hypothetical protein
MLAGTMPCGINGVEHSSSKINQARVIDNINVDIGSLGTKNQEMSGLVSHNGSESDKCIYIERCILFVLVGVKN